jgi:hypothetical protein
VQAAAETVPASHTALQVFVDMYRDHKTCMGVLDAPGGSLVGNISISDLRYVTPALYAKLHAPVGEFILALRGLPAPAVRATTCTSISFVCCFAFLLA